MPKLAPNEKELCILVNEAQSKVRKILADFPRIHYGKQINDWKLGNSKNVFVISSADSLNHVAQAVHDANDTHRLRALLIREENNPNWITRMLEIAQIRTLRNMLVFSDWAVPKRVLTAWRWGNQDVLIADAAVFGDTLYVQDCSLNTLKIPFSEMSMLRRIPVENRHNFTIDSDGSCLAWDASDVHLGLESFRIAIDPKEAAKAEAFKLACDARYGAAIASFRNKSGLKQSDIAGISDRHLRRVENGEHASIKIIELLATAHGLSVNDYMNKVAEEIHILKITN